jgi:hypothetical protein
MSFSEPSFHLNKINSMSKGKVRSVDSVALSLASGNGRVTVEVSGTVSSGGWSEPELVDTPRPPDDGNHHLDFVATPPDGIATQVILPISARHSIQAGAGKFCVVVHATTNESAPQCIEVQIGDPP